MMKLHATRHGQIVWTGAVGTQLSNVAFDAISMHTDDNKGMLARVGVGDAAEILDALAHWWECEDGF